MACREAEPWACLSRGNKCGGCRVGHGLRYSRAGGVEASWASLPASYGHVPVFGRVIGFYRQGLESQVQLSHVPNFAAVNQPSGTNAAILAQLIEFGGRAAQIDRRFYTRQTTAWARPHFRRRAAAHHSTRLIMAPLRQLVPSLAHTLASSSSAIGSSFKTSRRSPAAVIEPSGKAIAAAMSNRSGVSGVTWSGGGIAATAQHI